jgi:hypothetical protein
MNPTLGNWLRQPTTMFGLAMIVCAGLLTVFGYIPATVFGCVMVPALGLIGVNDKTAFASDAELLAVDAVTSATSGAITANLPRLVKEAMTVAADLGGSTPVAVTPSIGLGSIAPHLGMVLALLLTCSLLVACASGSGPSVPLPPAPTTASQALYEAESAFDIALLQAGVYAKLPRCGAPGAPATGCSNAATVATLYQDAQKGSAALATAKAALLAFEALINPTKSDIAKFNDVVTAAGSAVLSLTQFVASTKGN